MVLLLTVALGNTSFLGYPMTRALIGESSTIEKEYLVRVQIDEPRGDHQPLGVDDLVRAAPGEFAGEMERAMMKVHAKPPRPKPPRPEPTP